MKIRLRFLRCYLCLCRSNAPPFCLLIFNLCYATLIFSGQSLSFIPTITFAQCVATQDCATLGYTETSCNGGKGVKCHFGNFWACLTSDSEIEQQFCDKYGFKYTCSGTGYSKGVGTACNGKYTSCTCASGYEWNGSSCQKKEVVNGPDGEVYKCNGTVVGVRATGMDFFVAMRDLGNMNWTNANNQCQNYAFCGNVKGTLPTLDQLKTLYNNKSRVNTLLSTNGGTQLANNYYWSSTLNNDNHLYYAVDMSNGHMGCDGYSEHYVRQVLASF